MGIVAKTLDSWYKEHKITNAKEIKTAVSVNNRDYPKDYDSLILGTRIAVFELILSLESDLETAIKKAKINFRKYFTERGANFMELFVSIYKFFPQVLVKKLAEDMLGGVD